MHNPRQPALLGRGGTDSARVFRRAMRHSRRVRVLRVVVPACLALLLAGLTLATWLDPMRLLKRLPLDAAGLVISGTKITMASPKLTGYTRDQRWYEVTASAAAQDITKPDLVEMKDIRAKLEMQDKTTMNLSALDGLFDRKVGTLTLGRNIVLQSTSGLEIRLTDAKIDTATGNIVSERPVEVRMQQGTLNANKLEVTDSGEVVRFDGGVTVRLNSDAVNQATEGMVKP
jgi:lipopolysaccharide export system protein LptC